MKDPRPAASHRGGISTSTPSTDAISPPTAGEPAAFQHQDLVSAAECVREGRFPGTVAVGGINVGPPLGRKHRAQVVQALVRNAHKAAGIDVHCRTVHRIQHDFGHIRGTRDG